MKPDTLPAKYVLTVYNAIDEEPGITLSRKEFPFLSWALKELAQSFENDLKAFRSRNGYFPDTGEHLYGDCVQLSYETSPYCFRYFTVKRIEKEER